jgi:hypothetical protein
MTIHNDMKIDSFETTWWEFQFYELFGKIESKFTIPE